MNTTDNIEQSPTVKKTSKDYCKTFYEKHAELKHTPLTCPLCGGKYRYFNKSHHNNTKKHQRACQTQPTLNADAVPV